MKGEIPTPEISSAAYGVPVMGNPGLKERDDARFNVAWNGTKAMQEHYLKNGAASFEFAPDPRTGHECGDSRYLAIPYFDFWLQHRLPDSATADAALKPAADAVDDWKEQMASKLKEYIETGPIAIPLPPPRRQKSR